jgi:hypothetical protein
VIVKMIVEKQMECRLAGETEVLGENLPQRHFCPSQNPTWTNPGLNPGRRGGKPATNRLSYGAVSYWLRIWKGISKHAAKAIFFLKPPVQSIRLVVFKIHAFVTSQTCLIYKIFVSIAALTNLMILKKSCLGFYILVLWFSEYVT